MWPVKPAADEAAATLYRLSAVGYGRHGAIVALQALVQLSAPADSAAASCPLRAWRPLYLPTSE